MLTSGLHSTHRDEHPHTQRNNNNKKDCRSHFPGWCRQVRGRNNLRGKVGLAHSFTHFGPSQWRRHGGGSSFPLVVEM